ncbi:MAG: hypothetical protein JW969_17145 [Spirochaetales bacterium]|nr:hypothetical protein [Spirochaetales bacterium]
MFILWVVLGLLSGLAVLFVLYSVIMFSIMTKTPVYFDLPGEDEVSVIRNVQYGGDSSPFQLMDVYLPAGSGGNERRPAVIFISGDTYSHMGKSVKEWEIYKSYGRIVAGAGMVAVTMNRSMTANLETLHDNYRDIAAARAKVLERADEYKIDADKIAFWILSGGGCYLGKILSDLNPAALVCFYCLMDINRFDFLLSKAVTIDDRREFSGVDYIKSASAIPPIFIGKAKKDKEFINKSIDEFLEMAEEKVFHIACEVHDEGKHAFDALTRDERTREIIGAAVEFLKENL